MKLDNLQVLRAIAAYMVLLVHVDDIEAKHGQGRILGSWANVGDCGIDLFFVISGFVMVLVTHNTMGSARDAAKFIRSRATRIYPLWWICLSALVPIWLLKPELVYGGAQLEIDFLKDYLLVPKSEAPLLQTGWTLIHEMYFYSVFAVLLLFPLGERRRISLIILWGVLAVGSGLLISPSKADAPILRLVTNPMTLEFVAGAVAAFLWRSTKGALGPAALFAGLVAFGTGISLQLSGSVEDIIIDRLNVDWVRVILFLPASALIAYGAASVELRQGWKATGLPVHLGNWSYSLYLTHMLAASAFGMIWGKVAVPGIADNIFGIAGLVVGCTIVAWISYTVFEQPMIKRVRALGKPAFA